MSGFRKTGIFPYDPTSPYVSPPQITKEKPVVKATRKERKDNRVVKILFQEKSDEFNKLKENVEPKKKRSTFVPPYGAAITEDAFYEKKMMEKEKKEKEEKKERNKKEKEEKKERNKKEKEEKKERNKKKKEEKKEKKKGPCKRKQRFTPPYTQLPGPSDEIIIDDNVEKCDSKKPRTEKRAKTTKGKGKGPLINSNRGKGSAKKGNKNNVKVEPVIEEDDTVNCAVCGKWQPEALNFQLQIQLVTWGQCDECGCWVHLKFCSVIRELNDDDEFRCPKCENEQ